MRFWFPSLTPDPQPFACSIRTTYGWLRATTWATDRGVGVGVGWGVAVGRGVGVGCGVALGDAVPVGDGVAVAVGARVGCRVAVGLGVGMAVALAGVALVLVSEMGTG